LARTGRGYAAPLPTRVIFHVLIRPTEEIGVEVLFGQPSRFVEDRLACRQHLAEIGQVTQDHRAGSPIASALTGKIRQDAGFTT
jgi:hypothetical protein